MPPPLPALRRTVPAIATPGLALVAAITWLPVAFAQGQISNPSPFPQAPRGGRTSGEIRQAAPVPICFPPVPPPLDSPVTQPKPEASGRFATPIEMAAFVSEPFYPQLSTRILLRSLGKAQESALQDYRKRKSALQAELRAELERLRAEDPAARRNALQALARAQAGRLAQLERDAESLRHNLIASDQGWGDLREWHLSDRERRGFSPAELAQVMRGYAFYYPHLLPAQRRLLREIMVELLLAGDTSEKAAARQTHLFFQPELARVIFPDADAPGLAAQIAAYQSKKAILKKELFDAVSEHDGATLAFLRSPLRSLGDKQAPRLRELETLAEAIREGLAPQVYAKTEPAQSPLPPALSARIAALIRDHEAAEKETAARVERLIRRKTDVPVRVNYRFEDDGLKFVVIPQRGRRTEPREGAAFTVEELRDELTEVANEYGRRLADSVNTRDELFREAGEILGTTNTKAIVNAVGAASRIALLQETEGAHRDYRTAVFEPGLSPEQRRLLFDAAVSDLQLPLPAPEMQPTRRASSW